jgi:soluble cytochrome b562
MAQDNTAGLGTMLSFLGQGADAGDVSPAAVALPQINLPEINLPNQQRQGSGVLGSLLGNLASAYVGNKLQTHMDNEAAKEQGASLKPIIDEHRKALPGNSPQAAYLDRVSKLIDSGNLDNVKAGVTAYGNYTSSMADNFKTTATQKDLEDPKVQAEVHRKEGLGPVPSGTTRDENGVLTYAPMSTGGNYGDALDNRALALKNEVTPVQQAQLNLAKQANSRADEAAKRAEAKAKLDEERYQNSLIKDINPTHRMAYTGNLTTIKQIDNALKLIDERPESFGLKFSGGDVINQRLDPEGVKYRSAVSQIASVKRHDLSGAAVSPSEDKYLRPFLPNETDTPEAAKEKLLALRANIAGVNNDIGGMYKEGYRQALPPVPKDPYTQDRENRTVNGTVLNFSSAVPKAKQQAILEAIKSGQLDVEEGRKRGFIQ